MLEAKKEQCYDPLERDLIQDYLEDLICASITQPPPESTQETEPEHIQGSTGNTDKQILQTQSIEKHSINDKLCEAQGIEEIPWRQSNTKQVPLPLEVPEAYKDAARMLGLFKPTTLRVAELKVQHKKGVKAPTSGTSDALTPLENQPSPLPGLEYLEDLEDKDPIPESEHMIVENHGIKQGQKAQRTF